MDVDFYRTQSRWTDPGPWADRLRAIPAEPEAIVRAVSGLLLHPFLAPLRGVAMPERATGDREVRSVAGILERVHARDDRPLDVERAPDDRAFCVCAGFARVATAVFRAHGVPARCRAGFADYFAPGRLEDHWVTEWWDGGRWRRLDAQLDATTVRQLGIGFSPADLPPDRFVDGPTAWRRIRAGELDPAIVGLSPLGLAGAWFVVGDVMLDAAALNKDEMLPWEKWSIGLECGPDRELAPRWAAELDRVATELAGAPDADVARRVYRDRAWLRVPPTVVTFADGSPREIAVG